MKSLLQTLLNMLLAFLLGSMISIAITCHRLILQGKSEAYQPCLTALNMTFTRLSQQYEISIRWMLLGSVLILLGQLDALIQKQMRRWVGARENLRYARFAKAWISMSLMLAAFAQALPLSTHTLSTLTIGSYVTVAIALHLTTRFSKKY